MRATETARAVAQYSGSIVLVLTLLYLLLAVLPFYGNGIYLHSYQEIFGSFVDPKGYPPFVWFLPLQGVAALAGAAVTLLSPLLTPLTLLMVAARWRAFSQGQRAFLLSVCLANVLAVLLTWQARGLILTWLVD